MNSVPPEQIEKLDHPAFIARCGAQAKRMKFAAGDRPRKSADSKNVIRDCGPDKGRDLLRPSTSGLLARKFPAVLCGRSTSNVTGAVPLMPKGFALTSERSIRNFRCFGPQSSCVQGHAIRLGG